MERFHAFGHEVKASSLPTEFTWPFCYVPHPLCIEAAKQVRRYIACDAALNHEAGKGKMFGVLVCKRMSDGSIGFTAAFSGLLCGRSDLPYFVPPIYDTLSSDGFFKQKESEISAMNRLIETLESSEELATLRKQCLASEERMALQLANAKDDMLKAKAARDKLRKTALTPEDVERLLNESRSMKASYKRLKKKLQSQIDTLQERCKEIEGKIAQLKHDRKAKSAKLQQRLFDNYTVSNALGESKTLNEVFKASGIAMPPAGAGECAAPKLLNHAYSNQLMPLAMAEFWVGEPHETEIRHEGMFYPACKGKCGPILAFMLQGLNVMHDPATVEAPGEHHPGIIYDDKAIAVIDKPAGMLSVPGKIAALSVTEWATRELRLPHDAYAAHRLDMDTSGLLVIAKDKAVLANLQRQFETRNTVKRYCADIDGIVERSSGRIDLPLSPDYNDRPRQRVDFTTGKRAVTDFEVIARANGRTRITFTPLTGRTHQLRVHAASTLGLGMPIIGDRLYGKAAGRLHLHAEHLEFDHPLTGQRMAFDSDVPF